MEAESEWSASIALTCYFSVAGGIVIGSIAVGLLLFVAGIDYFPPPFSFVIVSMVLSELVILLITFLFARYEGVTLRQLGLRRPSLKILLIGLVVAMFLFMLTGEISIIEEIALGPDPTGEVFADGLMPNNPFQLVTMIVLSMILVGPIEELAFRGFIQRGFETSFGTTTGLGVTAILFGLLHGLNTLYAIIPLTVGGLALGYVWQKTNRNTTASAFVHGVYNSIAFLLAYWIQVV